MTLLRTGENDWIALDGHWAGMFADSMKSDGVSLSRLCLLAVGAPTDMECP
jgi:hypothetical protein